jgi:hypothetical protein
VKRRQNEKSAMFSIEIRICEAAAVEMQVDADCGKARHR